MGASRFILWRRTDRLFFVLVAVLVFVFAALVTLLYGVHTVRKIDGPSMEPTLVQADRILVTRGYGSPTPGDIVSVTAADRNGELTRLVKRIIAVPGDRVEIIGDYAWVNGLLSEVAPAARLGTGSQRLGPMTVPEGTVYVLGDNRPLSLDSRALGFVPISSIEGKVRAVIFPLHRFDIIDD